MNSPLPWKLGDTRLSDLWIEDANGKCVVGGCGCCGSAFGDNLTFDGPLMIAAPELLAALQAIIERADALLYMEGYCVEVADARHAITKATTKMEVLG